jgi:hypothetical protein
MPELWSIASVVLTDGRIALVATGDAAQAGDPVRPGVWWLVQETPGQVGWNGDWQSAGIPAPGLPARRAARIAASRHSRGGLAAAVCGDDNAIWYAAQEKPDGSWPVWSSLGTPPAAGTTNPSDPTLVQDGEGRIAVFVTVVGEVWTRRQHEPHDQYSWTSWAPVGGEVTVMDDSSARPTVVLLDDGRLEALAKSGSYLRYILEKAGGDEWAHWRRLGSPPASRQPLAAVQGRDRLVVALLMEFGHMAQNVQLVLDGDWEGWHVMVPPQLNGFAPLGMALALHADGRPVFLTPYVDDTGHEQVWLLEPAGPSADDWRSRVLGPHPAPELEGFARRIEDPVLNVDANGHLVAAFRVTNSTNIYWLRQKEINGDVWLEGILRAAPPAG